MNKFVGAVALALVLSFGGWTVGAPALAMPPTVTNSPGYDARLAGSKQAYSQAWQRSYMPATPQIPRRATRRAKPQSPYR
jgi:hypothetical protein